MVLTYDDKQINSQQINFVGKLKGDDGVTMFLVSEKQHKTNLNFFFRFINCNRLNNGISKNNFVV